jgi:two-component system sensor kinase FixL
VHSNNRMSSASNSTKSDATKNQQDLTTADDKPANYSNRLETLLQNLPGMAYRCLNREHWPMDFVSQGCYDLCGYHRHEIESQAILWGNFTHPDDIDEVDRKVRSAADNSQPFEVEYRIITRDGTEKWVWERGRAVDFDDNGVAVLEGFITDITSKKLSETALVQAEAYAQAVVNSAVEAVITIDDQGSIESFNQTAQTMFDYSLDAVRGMQCRMLVSANYYREFDLLFKTCHENTNVRSAREFNGHKNNGLVFPVNISISAINSDDKTKYVILIRDLTNQRQAEKEVREQRAVLAHVDRLNTLGEMAAGIAHEINQPLTAISMYAKSGLRFLENDPLKTDRLQDALEKLSIQAHRAGAVIERMQSLTKPGERQHESTNYRSLILEVHSLAEVEAQIRNIIIVLRIAGDLPEVICDPIQIQQVILNLLRNGMESMSSIANNSRSDSNNNKIILKSEIVDNRIRVSIVDSGLGISKQLAKNLYTPFISTKQSGMGLGLSISRSILSAHGSGLKFVNNKTGGATFSFSLPIDKKGCE